MTMPTAICRRSWRGSRAPIPASRLSVICEPSVDLLERIDANEVDLAIVTNCETKRAAETFRRERPVVDVEPSFDAQRGRGCRSRSAGRHAVGGASRSSGWNRSGGLIA
ncbi:MAG: hypothetical protein WDN48_03885 [Pseudolabrys sp.]